MVEYMLHDPEVVGLNIARFFCIISLVTAFLHLGLSTAHVQADWLLDWNSAAKGLPGPAVNIARCSFSFSFYSLINAV